MSRPSPTRPVPAGAHDITVTVTFFGGVQRFAPDGERGPRRYALPTGATLADLLRAVGIAPGADLTAAVDGALASEDTPLRPGADVMLLNPMEGGAGAPSVENAARAA